MSNNGFSQSSREILKQLRNDNELRLLYYDLAAAAHFGDETTQWGVALSPGQIVVSRVDIERRYRWTPRHTRTKISKLKKLGIASFEQVGCYRPDRPDAHKAMRITILDGVNGRATSHRPATDQPPVTPEHCNITTYDDKRPATDQPPTSHRPILDLTKKEELKKKELKTVLKASFSSTSLKDKEEDKSLPDHHNPAYAQHLIIAKDAFDQLAQTYTVHLLQKSVAVIDDCCDCWSLDQQEELLPRIIEKMMDKGDTIHSLPAFLEYHGRGAADSHPYGGELIRLRDELPKEEEIKNQPLDPEVLAFINERFGIKKMTRSSEITLVEDGMESDEQILKASAARVRIKEQFEMMKEVRI